MLLNLNSDFNQILFQHNTCFLFFTIFVFNSKNNEKKKGKAKEKIDNFRHKVKEKVKVKSN